MLYEVITDVVVLCQGVVRYGRQEFAREGWDAVIDVNLSYNFV